MAEPDHRSGGEPVTAGPVTPGQSGTTPVRSAPLRRRPKRSKPERPTAATEAVTDTAGIAPPSVDLGKPDGAISNPPGGDSAAGDSAAGDSTAGDTTAGEQAVGGEQAAPDPDELQSTLSYRERRQRRDARPAGPASVARRGGMPVRSDRAVGAIVAAFIAVVVIVGCLVAATVFAIGIGRYDRQNDLRAEYSTFAAQMTINMTSLNPGNVDAAVRTLQTRTSGAAQQRIKDSMQQAVTLVREQNLEVKSSVISSAVTKATDDEGSAIIVYGWQMKPENPQEEMIVQTFRWRVDMTRLNGELKMTNFEWVI